MIETKSLTKNFKSFQKKEGLKESLKSLFHRDYTYKHAVVGFDLNVEKGEIIGLLGPNGAGKTTLMKMLTGIIVPTSGIVKVNNLVPYERTKEFRKKIALVMGQKSQLWWDIPAMDSLRLLQKYYEIPSKKFKKRVQEMADFLDVTKVMHIHVRKLSLGERMKLELMASLLHDPETIFLDEPTIGLDLISQENIRKFILEYHREHKATIVLTSHYMADVEALCKRLVLIFDGKKKFDGEVESFEKILGKKKTVTFKFKSPIEDNGFFKDFDPHWNNKKTEVELKMEEDILSKTSSDILNRFEIQDFYTEKMPIEKVMKTLMSNPEIIKD